MSSATVLIEKILKRREFSVELEGDKKVTLRRPPEVEFFAIGRRGVTLDDAQRCAIGWSGFTEADLYAGGGSDAVEFDGALFREVVADRADWLAKCANAIVEAMQQRSTQRADAQGN